MSKTNAPADIGSTSDLGVVGRAFSVDDGLLALRWAEIVRSRGYRLRFLHDFVEADEALEIRRVPRKKAVATIFLGVHWIWVIDDAGHVLPYLDLATALCSVVNVSPNDRHVLRTARPPAWLWQFRSSKPAGLLQRLRLIVGLDPGIWRRGASIRAERPHPAPVRPLERS